ncbi:BnaAnng08470D [Brassica napus]|uniref:BnaAnng08470D protein n=1 Tax=Brassica napus TaxID=3708 RepID=A0A078IAJ2_BRANA|nr:BnaAnng08470D [Brassica napus]
MAKASKSEVSSDEAYSSEEEAQVNDQVNVEEDDDEELQAVARSADSDEEAPASDDEVVPVEDDDDDEVLFDLNIYLHIRR